MARVIPPLSITNDMLTSSTCAEPHATELAYNAGTTYALGDRVILGSPSSTVTITNASPAVVSWATHGQADGTPVVFTTTGALPTGLTAGRVYYIVQSAAGTFKVAETPDGTPINTSSAGSGTHTATTFVHRVYESLQASNTGHYPALAASSTWWADVGPTNRWAMFDLERNTGTTQASPLTVVLTPGVRVDSLALVGLVADSVTISITVSVVEVYTATVNLSTRVVLNAYDYCFLPFSYAAAVAKFDLPPYTNGVITVTITRASGAVTCGGLVTGLNTYLGTTIHSAEADALNFSRVTRDEYGNSELVPRRTVPKVNMAIVCEKANVNKARAIQALGNATPMLWSGIDDQDSGYFEAVLILGIYKAFRISMDRPETATISLELEDV
ncbi:hypothetical protein [Phenylobacterium sp.]|uniref:hypothetical protein n=1 Tax=Phenylobacterium sp. TaxID=1871053 RepID=UPI00271F2B11|nr:hypothetical protein [Phenylobacterium sp.]MDO8800044.1 hypothetical protein [Phenylobacterium sp.]